MKEMTLVSPRANFWGAAVTLSLATMLSRLVTFITHAVIARQFGTSFQADAYFISENVLLLLGDFIIIDFGIAFIPLWMEYQTRQGDKEAKEFTSSLILLTTGATFFFAVVIGALSPLIVRLAAPGFEGQSIALATKLLRLMTPAVAILGLIAGCTGILEAHRYFTLPELARLAFRLIVLIFAIFLSGQIGVSALALGVVFGSIAQFLVQLPTVHKLRVFKLRRLLSHPGVNRVCKLILPIFIANAGMRMTLLLGSAVASGLSEGAVAGLSYAGRVMLLPVGLLALPLRTTLFPSLARHVAEERLELVGETAIKGLRMLSFITAPVCVGLILLNVPIIQLLFQRGEFDVEATRLTANTLGWYAIGLPASSGLMVVNSIFFSMSSPSPVIRINLVNWAVSLGLSLAFVRVLGTSGIALGISLSAILAVIMAIRLLRRKFGFYDFQPLWNTFLKTLLAALVMSAAIIGFQQVIAQPSQLLGVTPKVLLFQILLNGVVGLFIYLLAALALKMDEANLLVSNISTWIIMRLRK